MYIYIFLINHIIIKLIKKNLYCSFYISTITLLNPIIKKNYIITI